MKKNAHHEITISSTPRTPRLKKIIFCMGLVISLICTKSLAQELRLEELPTLEELETSLKTYHNKLWLADRNEYLALKKKKWWYYLPSVGIQFGLPSVQFSTGTLAIIDRDKNIRAAKLKSIDLSRELEFNKQLQELRNKYRILEIHNQRISTLTLIKNKEHEIFKIYIEATVKKDMTPEEFKLKELKYLREIDTFDNYQSTVEQEAHELLIFAHYGEQQVPLFFEVQDCEEFEREH